MHDTSMYAVVKKLVSVGKNHLPERFSVMEDDVCNEGCFQTICT